MWARVRNWLAHRRAVRIGSRLFIVFVVIAVTQSASRQVRLAEAEWGETTPVAVARHRVSFGAEISRPDFELRTTPTHLAPSDALLQLPDDGFALRDLLAGDIVTSRDLAMERGTVDTYGSDRAVRADELIPPGFRTVGVPRDPSTSHLLVGDEVDLVVVHLNLSGSDNQPSTSRLPEPGIVVGHQDETIVVAVPQSIVNEVVAAVALGQLVAVLR